MPCQLYVIRGGLAVSSEGTTGFHFQTYHYTSPLRQLYASLLDEYLTRRELLLTHQRAGRLTLEQLGILFEQELLPLNNCIENLARRIPF